MYVNYLKRIMDFIISVVSLVLLSPIFLLLCILVKASSPGPIFFKQERMGRNGFPFTLYKFRSMSCNTPDNCPTHLLENPDSYITNIGKFLRKTSLDELPQLFNILKGDMSLVGPRPSLMNQTDLNTLRVENNSIKLLPGLTGLAQISGRDELAISVKAGLDGEYARNISFMNDVKIVLGTIGIVLKHNGIKEGK